LGELGAKLGGGSEKGYGMAIAALHAVVSRQPGGAARLDDAIAALTRIDAQFLVPDLVGIAAEALYRAGDAVGARAHAERALSVAEEVARPSEVARAHALLACLAAARHDGDEARTHLAAMGSAETLPGHVEGLRREAERCAAARDGEEGARAWP
jgi:hypothetical protein